MCAVTEFTQFTGTTVENTKGHWEVTVSAWVSGGWEWGEGEGEVAGRPLALWNSQLLC